MAGDGEGSGVVENVQKALEDLRSAGEKATGDVRSSIDSAMKRLRDVSSDAGSSVTEQLASWRSALESATDEVRGELGKLAIRAQGSLDSLEELAKEVDERRKQLGGQVTEAVKDVTDAARDATK